MNQPEGTSPGDRFGILVELNNRYSCGFPCASIVSVFIANDTSNIGTEIVPKIWSATVDYIANRIIVGPEVASSFVPLFVKKSSLGQKVCLLLDLINLLNGFNAGKYIVGFESTLLNPNGKS